MVAGAGSGRRRREAAHELDILNRGAWCVVSDMTGRVLSWIELGSMPDWRIRFAQIVQAAVAAGWNLDEEYMEYSSFFCRRGGQRISVRLLSKPPRSSSEEWPLPAPDVSIQECLQLPNSGTHRPTVRGS